MTEKEKAEQDLQERSKSIEETKTQLVRLTAEFKKNQYDLNQKIVEQGKDEYADIDMTKLLLTGRARHAGSIGEVKFVIRTMTKTETLFVDKKSKEYVNESNDYYLSSVQADSLAFVLEEYNGRRTPLDASTPELMEKTFVVARTSVLELSSHVVDAVWSAYSKMTRYIRANLELNLKN